MKKGLLFFGTMIIAFISGALFSMLELDLKSQLLSEEFTIELQPEAGETDLLEPEILVFEKSIRGKCKSHDNANIASLHTGLFNEETGEPLSGNGPDKSAEILTLQKPSSETLQNEVDFSFPENARQIIAYVNCAGKIDGKKISSTITARVLTAKVIAREEAELFFDEEEEEDLVVMEEELEEAKEIASVEVSLPPSPTVDTPAPAPTPPSTPSTPPTPSTPSTASSVAPMASKTSGPQISPKPSKATKESKVQESEIEKPKKEKKRTKGEIRKAAEVPQEIPAPPPADPLIASIAVAGSVERVNIQFSDVTIENTFAAEIKKVAEIGIMTGTPNPENQKDRAFKPDNPINRAEMATVLTRWLYKERFDALIKAYTYQVSKNMFKGFCGFKDLPKEAWYTKSVWVACFQYIFKGYPDKSFKPENSINQAEAIKVIVEAAARFSPKVVQPILDAERKSSQKNEAWFEVYIRTAEKSGILSGTPLDLMKSDPSGLATRAWVAYAIAHIPGLAN